MDIVSRGCGKYLRLPSAVLLAALLVFALASCSKTPEASTSLIPVATQDHTALTAEKIKQDLVRRRVPIYGTSEDLPDSVWTFDSIEPKQVQILEQQLTPEELTAVILMTTVDKPSRYKEEPIGVSGKLRLNYVKERGRFVLKNIENISFRYSVGVSI
jgi:hypothetical protein